MNNKGYSYIEVLMAGAIISIFLVPAILAMHQSMQNLYFSNKKYNGVILAESLLIEFSNSIRIMDNPEEVLKYSDTIYEVLNIAHEDFNYRYKEDLFNYTLKVYNYSFLSGEIYDGYWFFCGNKEDNYTYKTNNKVVNQEVSSDEVIVYEDGNLIITQTRGYLSASNNTITLEIPEYITESINIVIDLSNMQYGDMNINLINLSDININVVIKKNKDFPRENIYISYYPFYTQGGIITTVINKSNRYEFMIEVEVLNKSNNIINKVFRPIFIY